MFFLAALIVTFLISHYFSQLLFDVTGSLPWLLNFTSFELYTMNYFLLLTFTLSFPYLTQSGHWLHGTTHYEVVM